MEDERPPAGIEVESLPAAAAAPGYRDAGKSSHPPPFRIRCRRYVSPFTSLGVLIIVALAVGWTALVVSMLARPGGGHGGSPLWLLCPSIAYALVFGWLLTLLLARLVNVRTLEQRDGILRAWSSPLPSSEEAPRAEIPIDRIRAVGCARHTLLLSGRGGRGRYGTFFLVYARAAKKKGRPAERWCLAHRLPDASDASYVARALRERLGGETKYEEEL